MLYMENNILNLDANRDVATVQVGKQKLFILQFGSLNYRHRHFIFIMK